MENLFFFLFEKLKCVCRIYKHKLLFFYDTVNIIRIINVLHLVDLKKFNLKRFIIFFFARLLNVDI